MGFSWCIRSLCHTAATPIKSWTTIVLTNLISMSSIPPTTPFIKPEWVAICQSCSEPVEWQLCKDTTKGNQGRWFAVVCVSDYVSWCHWGIWGHSADAKVQMVMICVAISAGAHRNHLPHNHRFFPPTRCYCQHYLLVMDPLSLTFVLCLDASSYKLHQIAKTRVVASIVLHLAGVLQDP